MRDDPADRILDLPSPEGAVTIRLFPAPTPGAPAVVLVGGVGGGFDSPAEGLYPRLAATLPEEDIAVLRVRYRNPVDLDSSVADVRAAIGFLQARGHSRLAVVGHSFGGAVAIRAALAEGAVRAVVTIATQGVGTERVGQLHRPLLLLHGTADPILTVGCSRRVHQRAGALSELRLYEGAGHCLDEVSQDVYAEVRSWLREKLSLPSPA